MHDNEYCYDDDSDLYDYETYCEEREPLTIDCVCGAKIELESSWANECDHCGAEYNGSGQRLTDRRYWGEETGEHPADLARLSDATLRDAFDDDYDDGGY